MGYDKKAEPHLKKAIELDPSYIDAYINYGNLLKVNGKIEEGNKIYEKVKSMNDNPNLHEFLDVLLQTDKG